MNYNRKTKLDLVKGDERSIPNLTYVRKIVSGLEQEERETVLHETGEFFRARQQGTLSYLEMGAHLVKVRDVLKPHELWESYANSLPNMGIATAYRMIWAWENGQKLLSPATLRVAARDGYKLVEQVKDGGFKPDVAKAIHAVTKELGPAPEKEVDAGAWLQAVVAKKRKMAKPVNAQRTGVAGYAKKVVALVRKLAGRLAGDRQAAFVQKVIDELLTIAEDQSQSAKKPVGSVAA